MNSNPLVPQTSYIPLRINREQLSWEKNREQQILDNKVIVTVCEKKNYNLLPNFLKTLCLSEKVLKRKIQDAKQEVKIDL